RRVALKRPAPRGGDLPVPGPGGAEPAPAPAAADALVPELPALSAPAGEQEEGVEAVNDAGLEDLPAPRPERVTEPPPAPAAMPWAEGWRWQHAVAAAWLAGSAGWLMVAALPVRPFPRPLRDSP